MHAHESYPLDTKFFRKRSNQKGSIEELGGAGRMEKCRRELELSPQQKFFENVRIRRAALRSWEDAKMHAHESYRLNKIFSKTFESPGKH
jgi:hypothetical protein